MKRCRGKFGGSVWAVLLLVTLNLNASQMGKGEEYTNSIGMKMVRISAGSFMMGNDKELADEVLGLNKDLTRGDYDEQLGYSCSQDRLFIQRDHNISGRFG